MGAVRLRDAGRILLHPWIESQGFVAAKNEPCVFYNEKTGVLLRDRMMVACNMPTPDELKAAAAVTPAANERRSTRRKRRPVHLSGS